MLERNVIARNVIFLHDFEKLKCSCTQPTWIRKRDVNAKERLKGQGVKLNLKKKNLCCVINVIKKQSSVGI